MFAMVIAAWQSRFGRPLIILIGAVALFWSAVGWLTLHDAAVARQARAGYVLLAEKTAAQARADELQRQVTAGAQALEEHRKRLLAAELEDQQQTAEREQEILAYEALLSQANRRCALSADDLRFLQHRGKAPDQRRIGARTIPGKSNPSGSSGGLPKAGTARGPR